jgi:hypothetical protein
MPYFRLHAGTWIAGWVHHINPTFMSGGPSGEGMAGTEGIGGFKVSLPHACYLPLGFCTSASLPRPLCRFPLPLLPPSLSLPLLPSRPPPPPLSLAPSLPSPSHRRYTGTDMQEVCTSGRTLVKNGGHSYPQEAGGGRGWGFGIRVMHTVHLQALNLGFPYSMIVKVCPKVYICLPCAQGGVREGGAERENEGGR